MTVPTGNRLHRFVLALAFAALAAPAAAQEAPVAGEPEAAQATPAAPESAAPETAAPGAGAEAEPAEVPDDTVYATVNGEPITHADLRIAAEDYASQLNQIPEDMRVSQLLNLVIDMQLVAAAAETAGLDENEAVQRRMAFDRARVLRNEYFRDKAPRVITDEKVQEQFDKELAEFEPGDEVHLRHILLENEDDAKAVIAELDGGGDFAEIAKEQSKDPGSGANGGDLGFIMKGQTVPEFETAAFALEVGEVTKEPVQSQFGWHVIKLEEKRKEAPPELANEEIRIRNELTREFVTNELEALREAATIEIVGADEAGETPAEGAPAEGEAPSEVPPAEEEAPAP